MGEIGGRSYIFEIEGLKSRVRYSNEIMTSGMCSDNDDDMSCNCIQGYTSEKVQ